MNKKIGFIGFGKMANAIAKGIIDSKFANPSDILIYDLNKNALEKAEKEFKVKIAKDNSEVIQHSDVIVFAVKPFVLKDTLKEILPALNTEKIVISIAAGISIKTISEITGKTPVIRVMPNTPALVNSGMSAICRSEYASNEDAKIALGIFKSVGEVIETEEKYIDIITAISGSGPAFYYYVIDEIAKAGEKLGLDYKTALDLSAQTALGAAKMIMKQDVPPEQLIINVTTPGGCTEVGNNTLKSHNLSSILYDTIKNTMEKAKAMGD